MPVPAALVPVLALALQAATPPEGRFGPHLRTLGPLPEPADAAVEADGAIWLALREGHRLVRVGPDGTERSLGGLGSAPGELDSPSAVALLPDGALVVADTGNDRVQVLEPDGTPRAVLGEGLVRRPEGVAADAARVVVADTGGGRLVVLDHAGALVGTVHDAAALRRPVAVALDGRGGAWVADAALHHVVRVTLPGADEHEDEHEDEDADDGDPLAPGAVLVRGGFGSGAGLFGHPRGVAWRDGRLYVADADNHRVQVLDEAGRPLYEWGRHALRPREGEGSLHYPRGLAVAPDGAFVVVCEPLQDRAQVFGPTDEDPARFSTDPAVLGAAPTSHFGPAVDAAGDLLALVEPETQRLLLYDLELAEPVLVSRAGGYGDAPGRFAELVDVALDLERGTLHASDAGTGRIATFALDHDPDAPLRFDPRKASFARAVALAAAAERAGIAGAVEPGALALGPGGRLHVVDRAGARVLVLDGGGTEVERVLGAGRLDDPVDLAVGGDGTVVVSDAGSREVLALEPDEDAVRWRTGADAELSRPHGVAVDEDGRTYVVDAARHRVLVLDPEGRPVTSFGGEGLGKGEFYKPRGVAVDGRGRVVVLDHGNHRGVLLERDGTFVVAFGPRAYVLPTRR